MQLLVANFFGLYENMAI